MAGTDSSERSAAREAVGKAIQEWVNVIHRENLENALSGYQDGDDPIDTDEAVMVSAFAAMVEYQSQSLIAQEATGSSVCVPDMQLASTTRGLFEFGTDAFGRH